MTRASLLLAALLVATSAAAQERAPATAAAKPRARELGVSALIGGTPGRSTRSPTSPASRSATPRSSRAAGGWSSAAGRCAPA
jgi:hypothetical protein